MGGRRLRQLRVTDDDDSEGRDFPPLLRKENEMDVTTLKNKLLETLDGIDKDKLSLMDLQLYANILRTASEIQDKSYAETMAEMVGGFRTPIPQPMVLGDMKGGA